jgi:hypothetical protein
MVKISAKGPLKEDVKVEVSGGFRRAAVAVDATVIPLTKSGSGLVGSKKAVELDPPVVTMTATIKGGKTASYDIGVTINDVTKHSKGVVREGVETVKENWLFSDFKLTSR